MPPATTAPPAGTPSTGWLITVYITPLDVNYSGGGTVALNGCVRWCTAAQVQPIGSFAREFVDMVRVEGAGHVSSGPHAGWYLQYTSAAPTGWWLSPEPLGANGEVVVPFRSAAASAALSFGQRFAIADCGVNTYGGPIDAAACARFRSAEWTVTDRFDSGGDAARHIDLYLGIEQPGQRLVDSPYYQSWSNVVLTLR